MEQELKTAILLTLPALSEKGLEELKKHIARGAHEVSADGSYEISSLQYDESWGGVTIYQP